MRSVRLGILGSGKGTNCRAILESIKSGALAAVARVVISDVFDAPILDVAREFSVPNAYLPPGRFRTRLEPQAEVEVVRMLRDADVELVALAGFMGVVKSAMLDAFPRRIVNIHPSLLPKFPGLEAWKQALVAGERVTGCTVHYVDDGVVDVGFPCAFEGALSRWNSFRHHLHRRRDLLERLPSTKMLANTPIAAVPAKTGRN